MTDEARADEIRHMSDGIFKENISKKRLQDIAIHFYLIGKKDGIALCELSILKKKR